MKSELNFWGSLEEYGRKVVGRSPLPYTWIATALVVIIVIVSALSIKTSLVGAKDLREAIERATKQGDYATAAELLSRYENTMSGQPVLGIMSELEDRVYPERKVLKRIAELEEKLEDYPGEREIFLALSNLYAQLGDQTAAREYREKARVLDPNQVNFQ
jgi:tetratricopeptide (TPR) repeat protein